MRVARLKFWIPAIAWAVVIFIGSTDVLSEGRTSRFLTPLLQWLSPGISDEAIHTVRVVIRKGGHLVEYGVLAVLALAALNGTFRLRPSVWGWRRAGLAFALCAAYAVSDELHQSFVATRLGSPTDVLIDCCGVAGGLLLARLACAIPRFSSKPLSSQIGASNA